MKRKIIIRIIIIVFFLAGLSLLLYPLISNEWNSYRQSRLISAYDAEIEKQEEAGSLDYAAEWEKADAYNESLLPSVLPDSFAVAAASDEDSEEHQAYMACLNLTGDGMMGRVEIPKISVNLPIYHTTDEDILEQAAGHLEGKLPSGGRSEHPCGDFRPQRAAQRVSVHRSGPDGGRRSLPDPCAGRGALL